MDQLLEGIPRGTKKLQILRAEAARDPLSSSGEWKLIGPTSQDVGGIREVVDGLFRWHATNAARRHGPAGLTNSANDNVLDTESTDNSAGRRRRFGKFLWSIPRCRQS